MNDDRAMVIRGRGRDLELGSLISVSVLEGALSHSWPRAWGAIERSNGPQLPFSMGICSFAASASGTNVTAATFASKQLHHSDRLAAICTLLTADGFITRLLPHRGASTPPSPQMRRACESRINRQQPSLRALSSQSTSAGLLRTLPEHSMASRSIPFYPSSFYPGPSTFSPRP